MDITLTDVLTGLPNSNAFEAKLVGLLPSEGTFALILCDLDGLLYVNDAYGHIQGDVVLKQISDIIATATIGHGYAYRIGGDEFALLIEGKRELEVVPFAQSIRQKVAVLGFDYPIARIHYASAPSPQLRFFTSLTMSVGIAFYPQDGNDAITLVNSAEAALQICKQLKGDKIVVFDRNRNT